MQFTPTPTRSRTQPSKDETSMRKLLGPILYVLLTLQVSGAKAERVDTQVRDQLEYKKGRCLAAIVVTSKRLPANLTPKNKKFSDENISRGINLVQRVTSCVKSHGRDTAVIHNACAQNMGLRDSSFYIGFATLVQQAENWPKEQIMVAPYIECGHDITR